MITRIPTTVWIGLTLLLIASVAQGYGNTRKPPPKQPPQMEPVTVDGTVEKISSTGILIASGGGGFAGGTPAPQPPKANLAANGQRWLVGWHKDTKVTAKGSAKLGFLHKNQTIEFKGQFDGHAVSDKVGELTIVTLSAQKPLGIHPEGSGAASAGGNTGAVKHVSSAAEARLAASTTETKFDTPQMCRFVAQIVSARGTTITIHAKGKLVTVELTDDPKITVDLNDASVLSVGDKVSAVGKKYKGETGFCVADTIAITWSEPLTGKKKPPLVKPATAKSTHKSTDKDSESADKDSESTEKDSAKGDSPAAVAPKKVAAEPAAEK
jgi:hypothetical protein